jgi:hypothetical protein
MRAFTTVALAAAACLAGTQALALPAHLSDAQFIEASRCVGLLSSKTLGSADVAAMKQLVKSEAGSRMSFIYDRADQARDDAERDANRAGAAASNLVAERDGVCRALVAANGGGGGAHAATRSPS